MVLLPGKGSHVLHWYLCVCVCVCVHALACHPALTFTKETEQVQQQTSSLRPLNTSQVHLLAHWAVHVDGSLVPMS